MSKAAWPEVALGDVCVVNPPEDRRPASSEVVAFVPMAAVDAANASVAMPEVRTYGELGSATTPFRSGDVLVAKITPCFQNGKIVQAITETGTGYGSTEFHVVRPKAGQADPRFLLHFLRQDQVIDAGVRRMTGSGGQRRVPVTFIKELLVPLPAIEEQRRIAAVLDQADELRRKRRAARALLDTLTDSIFLDMFGDPVGNARGWPMSSVGAALSRIEYGHRFYGESYAAEGTRLVRITDLQNSGALDFDSMPRMALTAAERQRYALRPGDLIFARSGATVGKVALVREGDPECIAGAYFLWLRFGDDIEPVYARALLASPSIQEIISRTSRQAAQQNFSGPAIKRLPMPVPPISHQRRFTQEVSEIQSKRLAHAQHADLLDELFASLQHRAFRGEL